MVEMLDLNSAAKMVGLRAAVKAAWKVVVMAVMSVTLTVERMVVMTVALLDQHTAGLLELTMADRMVFLLVKLKVLMSVSVSEIRLVVAKVAPLELMPAVVMVDMTEALLELMALQMAAALVK